MKFSQVPLKAAQILFSLLSLHRNFHIIVRNWHLFRCFQGLKKYLWTKNFTRVITTKMFQRLLGYGKTSILAFFHHLLHQALQKKHPKTRINTNYHWPAKDFATNMIETYCIALLELSKAPPELLRVTEKRERKSLFSRFCFLFPMKRLQSSMKVSSGKVFRLFWVV